MKSTSQPTSWDFREPDELLMGDSYQKDGYIIENADQRYLGLMRDAIEEAYLQYIHTRGLVRTSLENAHRTISNSESNNLRLFVMQKLFEGTAFHRSYYNCAKHIIHNLCGNELAMQKRPGLSINLSRNPNDILPIHADTWNGVSPFELNIWIPFVDCNDSMCLYILKRDAYHTRLAETTALLRLSSDDLFDELSDDLTWIHIKYGQVLAFDQSLPHGYTLNKENVTHWSTNCRFKGLHTPYWDKKLGEYFMPITVKNCTRLGMSYKHPENWI